MGRETAMRRCTSAGGFGNTALIALAFLFAAEPAAAQGPAPGTEDPNNWPQYHRTYNGWRYSPLDQIDKTNVGKLKVAWIHQGGDITMGIQETPIVVDGVVYSITAGNRVAAIDAKTGAEIWRYQPKLDPITKKVLFSPYSRGVTVGRGRVFIGTVDGRGIAVDQKTGKELWQVQLRNLCKSHRPVIVI
jgi:alcohol dehydrogenase (cytochrome c)